jgi:carbon monoxide dehydrogenase subunit G
MAKLEISTVINRPVEEVFAFLSDYENNPKWISGSIEVKKTSEGPIGVGATYRTVLMFLGRRIESETELTEYEPNRRHAMKSKSGPFPVENRVTFERVNGGTRVTLATVAEPGGFFKLAEPPLVSMVKRQFEADFANLKDLMESHAL